MCVSSQMAAEDTEMPPWVFWTGIGLVVLGWVMILMTRRIVRFVGSLLLAVAGYVFLLVYATELPGILLHIMVMAVKIASDKATEGTVLNSALEFFRLKPKPTDSLAGLSLVLLTPSLVGYWVAQIGKYLSMKIESAITEGRAVIPYLFESSRFRFL